MSSVGKPLSPARSPLSFDELGTRTQNNKNVLKIVSLVRGELIKKDLFFV